MPSDIAASAVMPTIPEGGEHGTERHARDLRENQPFNPNHTTEINDGIGLDQAWAQQEQQQLALLLRLEDEAMQQQQQQQRHGAQGNFGMSALVTSILLQAQAYHRIHPIVDNIAPAPPPRHHQSTETTMNASAFSQPLEELRMQAWLHTLGGS